MRLFDVSCASCGSWMHACMQALSPHYIFLYFIRNGYTGWYSLGGLVLAITDMSLTANFLSILHPSLVMQVCNQLCPNSTTYRPFWLFTGVKRALTESLLKAVSMCQGIIRALSGRGRGRRMIPDMDVLGARAEALFADLGHFSIWTIRVCQLLLPFCTPDTALCTRTPFCHPSQRAVSAVTVHLSSGFKCARRHLCSYPLRWR